MALRAALFIDGFNLYHAVHDLGEGFLKWTDLRALGENIIPSRSEELTEVHFCTAFYPGDHRKRVRHEMYNAALSMRGVTIHHGHYVQERRDCPSCLHTWIRHAEKQSDINVALSLFDAAMRDVYDHAYLLSADSDQLATVLWFKKAFPGKEITIVVPPKREASKAIRDKAHIPHIQLNKMHFERAHMGRLVTDGLNSIVRPTEYNPPPGWLHPKDRP